MISAKDDFIAKARRNMVLAVVFGGGSLGLTIYGLVVDKAVLGVVGFAFGALNVALYVINARAVQAALPEPESSFVRAAPKRRPRAGAKAAKAKAAGNRQWRRRNGARGPAKAAAARPGPR